ncbi:MAG: antitoxin [Nocardiopsaceae bacterium]|nr:antitoxin [Nocardiopsaceae bacterium]
MPKIASAFNKLKKAATGHSDKVDKGIDKAAEAAKDKTGGKYDRHIDKAQDSASDYLRKQAEQDRREGGGRA